MYSRRDFGKMALVGLPVPMALGAASDALPTGVRLGATTYSLRDLPRVPGKDNIDDLINALHTVGVREVDLFSYNTEPAGPNTGPAAPPPPAAYPVKIKTFTPEERAAAVLETRNALRDWRLKSPANHYESIRSKFAAAGIGLTAYSVRYDSQFTDEEIDVTFRQAKTLGVSSITAPGDSATVKRLVPFAEKYAMNVSLTDFTLASALPAKYFKINLDLGQITAANGAAVAYVQENSAAIAQITVKDRRRNKGANEQFGDGDTPIREVLRLVKDKRYTFPVFAEYEYVGLGTPTEELTRCMNFMRSALA